MSDRAASTRWVADYLASTARAAVVASRTTAQTLTLNAFTTITWPIENLDPNNLFASPTFTAPQTGFYRFDLTLIVVLIGATNHRVAIGVFVGGAEVFRIVDVSGNGVFAALSPSATIALNAGQVCDIRVFTAGAGATGAAIDASQSFFINRLTIAQV